MEIPEDKIEIQDSIVGYIRQINDKQVLRYIYIIVSDIMKEI